MPSREVLLKRLERVLERAVTLNLPVTVEEAYVYGSILWSSSPNDIDVVLTYSATPEQERLWKRFETFVSLVTDSLRDGLRFYTLSREMSFPEYADSRLSQAMIELGLDPEWMKTLSWTKLTEIMQGRGALSRIDAVKNLLCRGIPKVHLWFHEHDTFAPDTEDRGHFFIWSRKNPDIRRNFQDIQDLPEFRRFLKRKERVFAEDLEKCIRKLLSVEDSLSRAAEGLVTLNFDRLNSSYSIPEDKSTAEKITILRALRKKCTRHREMLSRIACVLEWIKEHEITRDRHRILKEIFERAGRGGAEKYLREVLALLGLPEENVVTLERFWYGSVRKEFAVEPDPVRRKELLGKAEAEKSRARFAAELNRAVRRISRRYLVIDAGIDMEKRRATATVEYSTFYNDAPLDSSLIERFRSSGFEISAKGGHFRAVKKFSLEDVKTKREAVKRIVNLIPR